jgi:hypothetical protein
MAPTLIASPPPLAYTDTHTSALPFPCPPNAYHCLSTYSLRFSLRPTYPMRCDLRLEVAAPSNTKFWHARHPSVLNRELVAHAHVHAHAYKPVNTHTHTQHTSSKRIDALLCSPSSLAAATSLYFFASDRRVGNSCPSSQLLACCARGAKGQGRTDRYLYQPPFHQPRSVALCQYRCDFVSCASVPLSRSPSLGIPHHAHTAAHAQRAHLGNRLGARLSDTRDGMEEGFHSARGAVGARPPCRRFGVAKEVHHRGGVTVRLLSNLERAGGY